MIDNLKNLKKHLITQIEVADSLGSQFVYITINEAKKCLELAEAEDVIMKMMNEQAKTKAVFGRTKDGEFVTECGNCGTHLDKAYSNCPKCKKELDWNSNQI